MFSKLRKRLGSPKVADNIPSVDAKFDAWQRNLVTFVTAHCDARVADPECMRKLLKQQQLWSNDYAASTTAMAVAHGTRQAKEDTRKAFEDLIRELIERMEAVEGFDMADLWAAGVLDSSPPRG